MMQLALSAEGGYLISTSDRVFDDLAEVERLRPDLIILDWKMRTGQDGETFLHREQVLRQQRIPRLYKPFSLVELLEQVRQLLAESASRLRPLHFSLHATMVRTSLSRERCVYLSWSWLKDEKGYRGFPKEEDEIPP